MPDRESFEMKIGKWFITEQSIADLPDDHHCKSAVISTLTNTYVALVDKEDKEVIGPVAVKFERAPLYEVGFDAWNEWLSRQENRVIAVVVEADCKEIGAS